MWLPNPHRAIVGQAKVQLYLLSVDHPQGRFKAAVFNAVGYRAARWQVLEADLARTAHEPARRMSDTAFGQKYEVPAILRGPAGGTIGIVVVWLVRWGETFPRLVTAFPRSRP